MPMKIGASIAIEGGNFSVTSAKVVMYVNRYWLTATPPMKNTVSRIIGSCRRLSKAITTSPWDLALRRVSSVSSMFDRM